MIVQSNHEAPQLPQSHQHLHPLPSNSCTHCNSNNDDQLNSRQPAFPVSLHSFARRLTPADPPASVLLLLVAYVAVSVAMRTLSPIEHHSSLTRPFTIIRLALLTSSGFQATLRHDPTAGATSSAVRSFCRSFHTYRHTGWRWPLHQTPNAGCYSVMRRGSRSVMV